jgi:serine/threonine-protein kinase
VSLAPGSRLGAYEVVSLLGEGGMGQVYRARDTKLNRDVALKILPEAFALDGDRIARFRREAQVLAALNHPHIAQIYGFEDSGSAHALVLELVEGPTLADRIARGPIPVEEALPIATQIAEALETAHEQGIVHRDLKPANIKVRDDGTVKVLDFGLAKALEPASAINPSITAAPTITTPAEVTGVGVILGTAAYMSPEQVKGRAADKRSDVWAFGCVLYEMLTGKRAFDGDGVSDTLAAVLKSEPDWTSLSARTPPHIVTLVRRCLQKDVQKRVPHIGSARLELAEASTPTLPAAAAAVPPMQSLWRRVMPVAGSVLITAAIGGGAWWWFKPDSPRSIVTRFVIALPEGQNFTNTGRNVIAISPDGTEIVYTANQRLYLRTMSDSEARPISGIDSTSPVSNPVFSPDGRSIAFFSNRDETIKRIAVSGGAAETLGSFTTPLGMSWGADGLLIGQDKGILRVSPGDPNSGTSDTLVSVTRDERAFGPQILPGGKALLFTLAKARGDDRWETADIVVQSLPSGERKTIIRGGSDARYLPTGHIVYEHSGVIFAAPFEVQRLHLGEPVPMIEGVQRSVGAMTGLAQFSVAANGTLVYLPGPVSAGHELRELAIFDRQGNGVPLKVPAANIKHARVSPDGTRVTFVVDDEKGSNIWTYEVSNATAPRRLTFNGHNQFPIWTSDGERIAFQSDRDGDRGIFWQRADGTGTAERLTKAEKDAEHVPEAWSPKGDGFLLRVSKGGTNTLAFYSLKDKTVAPFGGVASPQTQTPEAAFSPDGRWVVYQPGANGAASAIYVQPFPATGAIYQLPNVLGLGYRHPRWSPDGKELFYVAGAPGNLRMFVASVMTQPAFAFGDTTQVPRAGFWSDFSTDATRQWDVMPDGQHFLAVISAGANSQPEVGAPTKEIRVVLNWFTELQERVPTK